MKLFKCFAYFFLFINTCVANDTLARISHTFSRQIAALMPEIGYQDSENSIELTLPHYPDDQDRLSERRLASKKCEKSGLDLEENYLQNFVKETKRIIIPGFPYAFNPSIIHWKGKYLLSFRAGKEYIYDSMEKSSQDNLQDCESSRWNCAPLYSPNRIGLIWLDQDFNPKGKPQLLEIPNNNPTYRQQDPRLVVVDGRTYILYSDVIKGVLVEQTRRMFVAELFFESDRFFVEEVDCLNEFEGNRESRWEKNWVPFEYENNLLLAYSINPHKILFPLSGTGVCCTIASTSRKIDWKWGELRGGTQALLVKDEYLAFFHSSCLMESKQSESKKSQHYFMGAYTFSAHPPFHLTRISPEPIVGKYFYNGQSYKTWKPHLHVVFPGGFVTDKKYIYIAFGRQDHEIWITKLDKEELFNSLVPTTDL